MQVPEQTLRDMLNVVVREVQPERIYLFGSQVTGNATRDSDIDLMIVQPESFGPQKRWGEMQRIRKALRGFRVAKDILVFSRAEFDELSASPNHIVGHVVHTGALVYERH